MAYVQSFVHLPKRMVILQSRRPLTVQSKQVMKENIAISKYPKLKKIKLFLENLSNQEFVRITGSGSAIVAYFQSKKN